MERMKSRLPKLVITLCLGAVMTEAAVMAPSASPLHDDLIQFGVQAGSRPPGAFYNLISGSRTADWLEQSPASKFSAVTAARRDLWLGQLTGSVPDRPLALRLGEKDALRLSPYWGGLAVTDGEGKLLETINGFNLRWEISRSTGLRLHLRGSTGYGDRALYASPVWRPAGQLAWVDSSDADIVTHDEIEGSAFFTGERFTALIGHDYLRLGHDRRLSPLMGEGIPAVNHLLLHYAGERLDFAYLFAELRSGRFTTTYPPGWEGKAHTYPVPKHLAYHRLAWHGQAFAVGFSDLVVFSEQPLRLGYLNPAAFFWSEEHYGQDSDNSLMMLDLSLLRPGWELWTELLVDDLSLADIFTSKPVNKIAAAAGGRLTPWPELMLSAGAGFARPFVFTHFHADDDYRHQGRSLSALEPNSLKLAAAGRWLLTARQRVEADWNYTVQGVGYLDAGNYHNVGSSFDYPTFDNEVDYGWLDGRREYRQIATLAWYISGTPRLPWVGLRLDRLQLAVTISRYQASLAVDSQLAPHRHRQAYNAAWLSLTLDHELH